MTHHSVMTSSLLIKILKIDKFGDFSSDIDFKTKMDHSLLYIRPKSNLTRNAVEDG